MKRLIPLIFTALLLPSVASADTVIPSSLTISDSQVWELSGSPYIVNGNISIASTGILTIEAGVEVRMQNSRKFIVDGALNIIGNETEKVFITAQGDDGSGNQFPTQGGRWGGFNFNPYSVGSINHLDTRYAGYGGVMLENNGGEVLVENSKLYKNNVSLAVYLKSGTTTISNSLLDENAVGMQIIGGYLSFTDSTISNTSNIAFGAYNDSAIYLRDNTFLNNGSDNGYIDINVDFDVEETTFIGGKFNAWIISGTLDHDVTLGPMDDSSIVAHGLLIDSGYTLTLEPGTVIKFIEDSFGIIQVKEGSLMMNGTEGSPIYLTSIKDDSVGGDANNDGNGSAPSSTDWTGVAFREGSRGQINSSVIRYSGKFDGYGRAGVFNYGGDVVIDNVSFENNFQTDIYQIDGTTSVSRSSFDRDNYAVIVEGGEIEVSQSSFDSHSTFSNRTTDVVDARNNWWGSALGPTPSGAGTWPDTGTFLSGGPILYDPWLGSEPSEIEEINPVVIVPGILGSAYKSGELVIDPILHTYDDLIATLVANGYVEGEDLFTFPYEWRDSNVFSANLLDDKISEIKVICECEKVDIVAHSMGGLVARAYIQSLDYDGDVDQLIFLGTPHKGSPESYLTWEGGELAGNDPFSLLRQKFFEVEALRNGYLGLFSYVRNRPILSAQELLPTFDYLRDESTGLVRVYPDNYPTNTFLESLDVNISRLLDSSIRITNIIGNSGLETINIIEVGDGGDPKWLHGKPIDLELSEGDNTVTTLGATLDSSISNIITANSHRLIPSAEAGSIYEILTGEEPSTVVSSGPGIDIKILLISLLSPVDMTITAPDGKKIGKNFEMGEEYGEIPLAFYSGFETDEEYITILNPLDGEYQVELIGTDNGGEYRVLTSYITDATSTTSELHGLTELGQITTITIGLGEENISQNKEVTLETLLSDINKSYELGWITDNKLKNKLIKEVNKIIKAKSKKKEKKIDKKLAKVLLIEIRGYERDKMNEEAYNLIKHDLEWLINN